MITPKLTPGQRKLVDDYAAARRDCASWRPSVNPFAARLLELEKQIMELADKQPAEQEVFLTGVSYAVPIGTKRVRRTIINVAALFKKLGKEWVLKNCIPSLGALDKALEPEERAAFVSESRDLSRIIGAPVSRAAASKAA